MKIIKKALEPQWFEFQREGEDEKASFLLRPFANSKWVFGDRKVDVAETAKAKFVFCVKDWKGITDDDDKPLPCTDESKGLVYDYDLLPLDLALWLRDRINKVCNQVEDIPKN